jgi:hypothetical protein
MSIADFYHSSVSAWARFFPFTEPVLSIIRFFASLRMTRGEGVRDKMTKREG